MDNNFRPTWKNEKFVQNRNRAKTSKCREVLGPRGGEADRWSGYSRTPWPNQWQIEGNATCWFVCVVVFDVTHTTSLLICSPCFRALPLSFHAGVVREPTPYNLQTHGEQSPRYMKKWCMYCPKKKPGQRHRNIGKYQDREIGKLIYGRWQPNALIESMLERR